MKKATCFFKHMFVYQQGKIKDIKLSAGALKKVNATCRYKDFKGITFLEKTY